MKKWYAVIIITFLLPIYALFFYSAFDVDATVSEDEHRMLATMPELSLQSALTGDFESQFETYYSDTFPFRENLLKASRVVNRLYAISFGDESSILIDRDDQWEGGNTLIDFSQTDQTTASSAVTTPPPTTPTSEDSAPTDTTPTETTPTETTPPATMMTSWVEVTKPDTDDTSSDVTDTPSDVGAILMIGNAAMEHYYGVNDSLDYYANSINRLNAALPDVQVYAMFCPTSIEFNAPAKYSTGIRSQLRAMNYAYSKLDLGIVPVNTWSSLYAHQDEYLYFRTDHHWTQRGAYYGYRAFCEAAGLTPNELSDYETGFVDGFVGTMYSFTAKYAQSERLLNNPDSVEYFMPLHSATMTAYPDATMTGGVTRSVIASPSYVEKLHRSSKYMMFLWGDTPLVHIVSDTVKNGRVLVVIKESYGNALVPFLTDHFEEIYAIDPREFNGSGEPTLNIVDFANEHGVTDFLFVNYAFSAQPSFMKLFNQMLPET